MMQAAAKRWRDAGQGGSIVNIVVVTTHGLYGVAHSVAARAGATDSIAAARTYLQHELGPNFDAERIDASFSLDLRVAKRFKLGATELEAYLDVQNVTNRENPEELAYSPDYSEQRPIRGLPILPVLGARWEF